MSKFIGYCFLATILFCSCDSGLSEEEQRQNYIRAINYVLTADAEATKTSNGNKSALTSKMRDIDLSQCPADFATAYVENIQAWEYSAQIQKAKGALKEQEGLAVLGGILTTIAASKETPFSDHLEAEKEVDRLASQANSEIIRTWNALERIAVSYGATLPQ